jgi:membrane-bound serine protease (ClpP class)
VEVGQETLIGRTGITKTELAPTGMVQVAGELWSAKVEDRSRTVPAGEDVEVTGVEGLSLKVRARDG